MLMGNAMNPTLIALGFAALNALLLLLVLRSNQKGQRKYYSPESADLTVRPTLDPTELLGWEFEYASGTAAQAMADRHTMVNFYLLAVGISLSGVLAIFAEGSRLPRGAGTLLLWLVCGVGWIYFLSVIRLRQAWWESARAMVWIKEFYITHNEDFAPDELRKAFAWSGGTLPSAGKPWTVFFYSAMLIGLLNSLAFLGGALLIAAGGRPDAPIALPPSLPWLLLFALGYFVLHAWLYSAFLRDTKETPVAPPAP
jgi:hypothetical protein